MMGKLKAYASVHPVRLVMLLVLFLYPFMRAFGLPNFVVTFDDVAMFAGTFFVWYLVLVCCMKYASEIIGGIRMIYTKLGLEKHFGECNEISRFDVMINKIKLYYDIERFLHRGAKVRKDWRSIFESYIIKRISVWEEKNVEFDSYDLAAMIAFAMFEEPANPKTLEVIYGSIKELLLTPASCILTIDEPGTYDVAFDLIDVYKEAPVEDMIFSKREFKKTVKEILKYSLQDSSVGVYEIRKLAETLRKSFSNAYMF